MRYISEFRENEQVTDIYLCMDKQILKTKAGKTYYSLRIQDKTGNVDAKIWDLNDGINHFEGGDYIKIDAMVIMFQGSYQLNIRRVRKANEGEYDPKDYIPVSAYDPEVMYKELMDYVGTIQNNYLKLLVHAFFVEDAAFIKRFKTHTAAKTMHHNYQGGLLEHTLAILGLCEFYAKRYKEINRDLLYTAALFHDIGKLEELSAFPIVEYTDPGQLLGHIMIGIEWVGEKIRAIPGFPPALANLLKHCIISHHGELEYGSPKKPQILEAFALNFADNTDAKFRAVTAAIEGSDVSDDWIGYQRNFETNLRRTRY